MAASDITVTEILYDPSQTGSQDILYEWVEIKNTGPDPVSLNGWTLDDSRTTNSGIGTIPDTTLQPGDIAIFYNGNISEADFLAAFPDTVPGTILIPVTSWQQLNNGGVGDTVNLYDSTGATIASVSYTDDASPGESLNYTEDGVYEGAGTPDPGVVCFTAGSMIDTQNGPCRIEELQPGDLVRTLDHGLQPLRWIGQREVSSAEQLRHPWLCPVEIKAGALGPQAPIRRSCVSPQHRVLIDSEAAHTLLGQPRVLCAALSLAGGSGIHQLPPGKPVSYVHILFDQHEIVFVDGHASESFHPNQEGLSALSPAARAELLALFPALENAPTALAYPVVTAAEAALLSQ